ncbi:PAS domain-containing methyl-accepting chemotaxis protein [Gallaecimonas kandeliae]|uniref:methyl-accepting chemotaxis protein n=1 Tax=Gallaecimonas kandeliae TaxID=3029055 RepID=UPI00264A15CD|nr:PAS domain-containing methyl-accepting chemotaxis protein [Gallaecimonas kandeliae]WKE67342.1 PAS domain-containing methyl-accepting chemotaxis protein [Gallaecimonas kandeliae]
MRNNLPVTNQARHLDPRRPLVSVTDLRGNILHANPAFIDVSGFTPEELVGHPHNIIRHPDMPPEAFADMWRTIKSDFPWRGLVKNRCKNGDYYWVDAYVTPVFEQGQKTGYMSVRVRPEPQQIARAEALYAAVRRGEAPFPATRYRRDLSLTARVALLALCPSICFCAALLMSGPWRWLAGLAGVASALALGLWMGLGILSPLKRIGDAMSRIAAGDLRFELDTRAATEFTHLLLGFQSMKVHLRAMFADMLGIAGDIETQSNALNNQVETATQRIRQGADSVSMMAAATEELSASVTEISHSTRHSADHATAAAGQVDLGVSQICATLEASRGVEARMDNSQQLITELEAEVSSIKQLALIIKEIADQTNLLALNAAIEAARAGESGRGFAVVADEVRKLAERTSGSTVEIATAVERIDTCTAKTLAAMAAASKEMLRSNDMMEESRRTYDAIKVANHDIQSSAHSIAEMLGQQELASTEVAGNIEQISLLMVQNSSSVESIREAAARLGETAHQLHHMTSRFENSL